MTVRDEATALPNGAMTTMRNQLGVAALGADDHTKGGTSRLLAAGGILAALGARLPASYRSPFSRWASAGPGLAI